LQRVEINKFKSIAIIGSGSWATAICKIVSESKDVQQICWWLRKSEYVEFFNTYGHNPNYLSSILFDKNIVKASNAIEYCIQQSELIILALPSAFVQGTFADLPKNIFKGKTVVTAIKGLVPNSQEIISEYLQTKFNVNKEFIACVSGPCHAEEVARERLSYLTCASSNNILSASIAELFKCRYINTSVSDDIVGIEYAAILKNIYAIAAGIANGLGYGDNFKAVLISFSIREMENFLEKLGIATLKVNESAYLGDLLVTAYSQFSRNRTFGNMLGREYSVSSAQMEMKMIAEGYYSAKQIYLLNQKLHADMPVMQAVYNIIYENTEVKSTFAALANKIY
jgi:glycerol-3-phosphate dehydrogenase (NAD(P)+)